MKELLEIKEIGKQGFISDLPAWSLPSDAISYGENFRSSSGGVSSNGGYATLGTPVAGNNPGFIFNVKTVSDNFWLLLGRDSVLSYDGSFSDISSAIGYTSISTDDELDWDGCMLGQIPILNNPRISPEYWSPQSNGQVLLPLPFDAAETWDVKGYHADVIRKHKTFLFALNLEESGTEFPDSYRWSHPADINGIPFSWDEADPSTIAGKAALGVGGKLIDGMSLRDSFCMYSESAINILDYTGDEFVWRRRELSSSIGLLSKRCIAEVNGMHYFLSKDDIMVNNGSTVESIGYDRIKDHFNSIKSSDKFRNSYVSNNILKKEVWFCIPDKGDVYPTVAFIYNWKKDSWSKRSLPSNLSFCQYGVKTPSANNWSSNADGETWDSQSDSWGSGEDSEAIQTIIGCDNSTGSVLEIEIGGASDVDVNTIIERTDFPLVSHKQVTTITRVYPHIDGTQPVEIQFGSQDYAGAPIRWKPAKTFVPGVDRKVDLRTTGELHCWRFSSSGKGHWRLSGMDIEFTRGGLR